MRQNIAHEVNFVPQPTYTRKTFTKCCHKFGMRIRDNWARGAEAMLIYTADNKTAMLFACSAAAYKTDYRCRDSERLQKAFTCSFSSFVISLTRLRDRFSISRLLDSFSILREDTPCTKVTGTT